MSDVQPCLELETQRYHDPRRPTLVHRGRGAVGHALVMERVKFIVLNGD